ncbi:hypothetical protein Tco_0876066 [Tanacetum coccineum]|uniref:Uncharacterized protein n=1 Tax=Tanacetum coccineum TaxID=301880 RepID=A0ABQ5BRD6_9ASTR
MPLLMSLLCTYNNSGGRLAKYLETLKSIGRTSQHWEYYEAFHDQKKEAIQYPRFIKLIIPDLMKKFLDIPQRIEEDYHSIKDDIPLVSVYTTGNVLLRGMLIPDAFLLTEEIHATNDFKEYKTVFMNDRLEPGSHKDNPEHDDDDDNDEEKVDEKERDEMGSLETRIEKMQTTIPTPPRSPRTILSLDKHIT